MNLRTVFGTLLLAGGAILAPAQETGPTMVSVPGKLMVKDKIDISAVVTALDAAKRTVTLRTADGDVETIAAGPEVINFDQIKVGDAVHATAVQSLTVELLKGGAGNPQRLEGIGGVLADQGVKPGAAVAASLIIIADVVAVDRTAQTVSLKGKYQGVTLAVYDPAQFKLIQVGDRVKGTYEMAVAVAMAPVAKK